MRFRLLILTAVLLGAVLIPAMLAAQDPEGDPSPAPITLWAQVYWSAPTMSATEFAQSLSEAHGATLEAVAHWVYADQQWTSWRPGVPAFVNAFTELEKGQVYWFRVTTTDPNLTITPPRPSLPGLPSSDPEAVQHFTGTGTSTFSVRMAAGLTIVDYTHEGSGRFRGEIGGLVFADVRGRDAGFRVAPATLSGEGSGIFTARVTASGEWAVTVRQLTSEQPEVSPGTAHGCLGNADLVDVAWEAMDDMAETLLPDEWAFLCEHTAVTPPLMLDAGHGQVLFDHDGEGPFRITLLETDGSRGPRANWVNESGAAQGRLEGFLIPVGAWGTYRLLVEASGPWVIRVLQ